MFCILRKIIRKNLNKRMTLSKDLKRSERMTHEETRITSLVEGTVNAKTCKENTSDVCLRGNEMANMTGSRKNGKAEIAEVEDGDSTR